MKLRVTSVLLGILLMLTVVVPAFAVPAEKTEEDNDQTAGVQETVEVIEEIVEEEIEEEVSDSPFYLNDEQLTDLEYQMFYGMNYVTVQSFLSSLDPECMIEEEDGVLSASAVAVTGLETVSDGKDTVAEASVIEETLAVSVKEGNVYAVANGRYLYVPTGVVSINGKVALPIRTLARMFNLEVGYDAVTRHVQLIAVEGAETYIENGDSYYDENTLYWLSRIIYSESGNQSLTGKLAVGNVVMNRLADPGFPNTIKGVLFQKNQFSPAMSGSIYRKPNAQSVVAAKLVMDGACVLEDALFFNRAGMNTFASRNRTYVTTIGAHAFYA